MKSGSTKAMGSVEVLGKLRGVQKRISLKLETRTNNNHSKGIKYICPVLRVAWSPV